MGPLAETVDTEARYVWVRSMPPMTRMTARMMIPTPTPCSILRSIMTPDSVDNQ